MNCDDFCSALRACMPSREKLEAFGLDEEEIGELQSAFLCEPRGQRVERRTELERLVSEYDCTSVEISLVSFLDQPADHPEGVAVASFEADPIVILPTGEVVVFDHSAPGTVITLRCASDSESFLDAMAALARMISERKVWKGRSDEAVSICVEKAGGSQYQQFYESLTTVLR